MIQEISNSIRVFRDDIFPFLGGGNKGRKILSIGSDVKDKGCNAIVTTGGIQSNHCRAAAILAAQNKWKCTLVLHGSRDRFYNEGGNALLMRSAGVETKFVEPAEISDAMDAAMNRYTLQGHKPYYIWGGGHTPEGGLAYIEAAKELKLYCDSHNWYPDHIFLASGTGSTQSGLMAGLSLVGLKSNVIGISVARKSDAATKIVYDFYKELCARYNIKDNVERAFVSDDYLCGGYEKYGSEIKELCSNSIKDYGFALDSTYSGKAFWGMKDIIQKEKLTGNILFWHTGGFLNYLS
ncbi:1-aminocyclopropane-1-carboxylate deaminase/D-cysteine desulfhydrase [Carboxylicivirga sp. RSCT41]|uniref:1-aminocyclopropane-1-carboxylate deaminase/D-cysteine desulfhydrase n=1 Tax=Carboxylicivirga agarovorans TaxID=3417570 RepID=UPI003D33A6B5